jgi:hypothetical protein
MNVATKQLENEDLTEDEVAEMAEQMRSREAETDGSDQYFEHRHKTDDGPWDLDRSRFEDRL